MFGEFGFFWALELFSPQYIPFYTWVALFLALTGVYWIYISLRNKFIRRRNLQIIQQNRIFESCPDCGGEMNEYSPPTKHYKRALFLTKLAIRIFVGWNRLFNFLFGKLEDLIRDFIVQNYSDKIEETRALLAERGGVAVDDNYIFLSVLEHKFLRCSDCKKVILDLRLEPIPEKRLTFFKLLIIALLAIWPAFEISERIFFR